MAKTSKKTTSKSKAKHKAAPVPSVVESRVKSVQKRLDDWKVDALLVTNPVDIKYLSGFVGEDSWALVTRNAKAPFIISDFRFIEHIPMEAPWCKFHIRKNKQKMSEALKVSMGRFKLDKVGFQPQYVTVAMRKAIIKEVTAGAIKPVDDGLKNQRAVKTADEIKLIETAGEIQQEAFRKMLKTIKVGQTESQIAARLEFEMRMLGAETGFPTIVAADVNACLCHAIPGQTKVRKGGAVLIDWGASYQGYRSDMTRVLSFGKLKGKMREIYQVTLEAHLAAIEAIKPGVECKAVDKIARDIIDDAGYGEYFGHSLGHGIGLNIHENPNLSMVSKDKLQPGHVVTVEPGIYLPGLGGVHIEDDVLVTEDGHRELTTDLPKSVDSTMI